MAMATIAVNVWWLAANIYFEARNQSFEGMVAVGHVTINRTFQRDMPVKAVVWQHAQFSWTLDHDPQGKKIDLSKMRDLAAMEKCIEAATQVAEDVFNGKDMGGINHYHHKSILPYWARGETPEVVIDDHMFYRL